MRICSVILIYIFMMTPVIQANAKNYPCSKSMGGVSHCKEGKFVSNDGRISQPKKVCSS